MSVRSSSVLHVRPKNLKSSVLDKVTPLYSFFFNLF
uniref:Uncharacterized protein n=1 Tax=Lepeophtheirus salmonis TaxID=72036 RepID=A0A0K2TR06_LEPSM